MSGVLRFCANACLLAGLAFLAALFSGCAIGPDYKRPDFALPNAWRFGEASTNSLADLPYTWMYRDPTLNDLIAAALSNSPDVRGAMANIEQAAAALRIQRADYWPGMDASATYTKARQGNISPLPGAEAEQYELFGVLSYEIDAWGRVRRLNEAARAKYLATEEAKRSIEITLIAGVASAYFNLRALDRQLEIANATLVSRQDMLELAKIKFDDGSGIVSELDVAQAQTQVAATKSSIAGLLRSIATVEHALCLLLGGFPGDVPRGLSLAEQWQPEDVPAGLQSDLLLRRPDVRAAEQTLIAANANIGVARAAYFPTISLTAALGLQSEDLGDLFNTGLAKSWSFSPGLTAPIFHAGKIRSNARAAVARRRQALAEYEKTVQTAFREVADALAAIKYLRLQLEADKETLKAETLRLDLSQSRYEGGVASYSDVLDAQRYQFSAELTVVQTQNDLLNAGVQLYKALGGGWQDEKSSSKIPQLPARPMPENNNDPQQRNLAPTIYGLKK